MTKRKDNSMKFWRSALNTYVPLDVQNSFFYKEIQIRDADSMTIKVFINP